MSDDTINDELDTAALDAACAALPGIDRSAVEQALAAAHQVYADAEQAEIDQMMGETMLAGMGPSDRGWQIQYQHSRRIAASIVHAFDAFMLGQTCENYTEQEFTITDPATQQAIDDGLRGDDVPLLRKYTFIVVKPGGKTPHQLRQEAERLVANALALTEGAILLDPRAVATALGRPPECTCPAGPIRWADDFDPECPRHGTAPTTSEEIAELLTLARPAVGWAQGAWVPVYHDHPGKTHHDGLLANALCAVLDGLRPGAGR